MDLQGLVVLFSVTLVALLQLSLPVESAPNETLKAKVFNDNSNDDALPLDAQGLIKRSGFDYEQFYVLANDGYVTQIIRLINPKADQSRLKKPPVLMYHGANLDPASYLFASSIQHFPEKYPRTAADGPIRSSNRSLAFTLSNNGFDVFLVGMRGCNPNNQGYINPSNATLGDVLSGNISLPEAFLDYARNTPEFYFRFSFDEIIENEIKNQIDKVREITGSREIFLFTFSFSTDTTLGFLSQNPDYAKDVRQYIQMGPAITPDFFTEFSTLFYQVIVPVLPSRGIGFFPTLTTQALVKGVVETLAVTPPVRYTVVQGLLSLFFGPSEVFVTNLERNVLSKLFLPASFRMLQHYGQHSISKRFRKFDYGLGNLARYGQLTPPEYNISRINVQNYAIISGVVDVLAGPATIQRLISNIRAQTPITHLAVDDFNHFDLLAGTENDIKVNLPTLKLLNSQSS